MSQFLVSSYNNHSLLAHKPSGKESKKDFYLINYNNIIKDYNTNTINPSFLYKSNSKIKNNTKKNNIKNKIKNNTKSNKLIIYNCLESIEKGYLETYSFDKNNFKLQLIGRVNSNGLSTCFIQSDLLNQNLIVINYWDSTISINPLNKDNIPEKSIFIYKNNYQFKLNNLKEHLHNRQSESHNHSIYFYNENIIIVPDLGKDELLFFYYDYKSIKLVFKYLLDTKSGPRYLQILNNYIYVINELDSSISVLLLFIDKNHIENVVQIQKIKTIPNDYKEYNTCGNILLHPLKKYLFASNRGHNSIAIYKILENFNLKLIKIIGSKGKTPRHFTINQKGNKLLIANQDSDNIVIYNILFKKSNNAIIENIKLEYFNTITDVNSPNYILEL